MTRKIGAHVSASGGLHKAVERAAEIGCNCVQVFSGSPRVWAKPDLAKIDTVKMFSKQQELNVSPIFTHAIYLVNLGSDNPELVAKSVKAVKYDLHFDSLVKGAGVVVHVGSHQGRGWDSVRDAVAATIKEILDDTPGDSTFLIENAAAKKGKIGNVLYEVQWLIEKLGSNRLGWCLDTCHAFAAGYSLDPDAKDSNLVQLISQLNLWDSLKCLHVNDSRDPFDSGRDRHANIGDGLIPIEDLKAFLTHEKVSSIPIITEVPGLDDMGPDKANVDRIKILVGEST